MNAENILKVADAIENHSVPGLAFNMGFEYLSMEAKPSWMRASVDQRQMGEKCGAVACFIGWTNSVFHAESPLQSSKSAGAYLGLDEEQYSQLFYPSVDNGWPNVRYESVTPEQAVHVLRHFAATGEIDWTL